MCVSTGRAWFTKTGIYQGRAIHPTTGKPVVVTMYQNNMESDGPCAMILPVPAAQVLTAKHFISTAGWGLEYLTKLISVGKQYMDGMLSISNDTAGVFTSGAYTVVSAARMADAREALRNVPDQVRPTDISEGLILFMDEHYPAGKFVFVIACFNANILTPADPICYFYEPAEGVDELFLPMIDAHTGNAPKPGLVERDHNLAIGYNLPSFRGGSSLAFDTIVPPEHQWIIPHTVVGFEVSEKEENGDGFWDSTKTPHFTIKFPNKG